MNTVWYNLYVWSKKLNKWMYIARVTSVSSTDKTHLTPIYIEDKNLKEKSINLTKSWLKNNTAMNTNLDLMIPSNQGRTMDRTLDYITN